MRALAIVLLLSACSDPGTFKPVFGGKDHPFIEERARAAESEEEMLSCEYMGTVEGAGDDWRYAISHTAAIHGATHYVMKNQTDTVEGYRTDTRAYVNPQWGVANSTSTTTAIHNRSGWAKVYYCGRR